ncbi:BNR repeat-containing protein [Akkermansiaceae bacterium]|nr:BNR repeat-containing protein [Akkermansiaceae bacterium]MDB4411071.1 BNR repeat-containing protein [bacterium]MDB4271575.1 BNR repeat-containing protein [Akkermansiaceae bacterium]MDB4273267.1 BNR repeat-containing protein [Akkermansiaceae bacterium]MDB4485679.1 BNR repeat-containing protein [bacterium]
MGGHSLRTDYEITNNDSHNVVTLGICALDGTIHLASGQP